eukprot:gnl/Spiro4/1306_TR698_c0_g1_i1.p1 gnl/Spiro4/1306_TR698_c0_g1~~gnl/Spiro4/1306_TR698_c0_g1_i1.p1  ORF type:complete len:249 (+),score=53.96 gnl/Spiro4/1306_TR698_c0_g1_i1:31-747(+)
MAAPPASRTTRPALSRAAAAAAPKKKDKAKKNEDSSSEALDESDDEEDICWIQWYCSVKGNEFFCEVDEEYINDDFNMTGLRRQVPYYQYALDVILDYESPQEELLTEEQHELIESAAELLYGLVHARFVLTARGLAAMRDKFTNGDFGSCPRVHCQAQPVLPVGSSDKPCQSSVKVYCPRCHDIYNPKVARQSNHDGAFFGRTFPHLFLMTYPELVPTPATTTYVPRIYGFKIHNTQ